MKMKTIVLLVAATALSSANARGLLQKRQHLQQSMEATPQRVVLQVTYIVGEENAAQCPTGYELINSVTECDVASRQLGITSYHPDRAASGLTPGDNRLPFCWQESTGQGVAASFNAAGDRGPGVKGKLLCKKMEAAPQTPAPPAGAAASSGSTAGSAFVIGAANSIQCPSGFEFITTNQECDAARAQLGVAAFNAIPVLDENRLPYCWQSPALAANFNPAGDRGSGNQGKLICKKSQAPATPSGSASAASSASAGSSSSGTSITATSGVQKRGGLKCVKWRRTLTCSPSGPRDPMNDKDCEIIIDPQESGYCECEGYVHTAAVPCGHAKVNCTAECGVLQLLHREKFMDGSGGSDTKNEDRDDTGSADAISNIANGKDPYAKALRYGDQAMSDVNRAVKHSHTMLHAAKQMMSKMMSLKPWADMTKMGKDAEEAGRRVQELSKMARPFIYTQVNSTSD